MSSYALEPLAFTQPTATRPFLDVAFALPPSAKGGAIHPATRLQVSVADQASGSEAFLEPLTGRDVSIDEADPSRRSFQIPQSALPFLNRSSAATAATVPRMQVAVKLHAWRGERWLGSWEVGRIAPESVPVC